MYDVGFVLCHILFSERTGIFAQNMGHTSKPLIDMEEFKKRRMVLLDSQVIF